MSNFLFEKLSSRVETECLTCKNLQAERLTGKFQSKLINTLKKEFMTNFIKIIASYIKVS